MKKSKKNNIIPERTNSKTDKFKTSGKITIWEIEKNFGFLGTKGRLLKALMVEKKIERNL